MSNQTGFIKIKTLCWLAVLAGAVLFGRSFLPLVNNYVTLRFAVQELAAKSLNCDEAAKEAVIQEFISAMTAKTGVNVLRSGLSMEWPTRDECDVTLNVALPYRLPFAHEDRFKLFAFTAKYNRIR